MLEPGDRIAYTITYLEITAPPSVPPPPLPMGQNVALIRAKEPPVGYFLYLYGAVGAEYEWTDRFAETEAAQRAFVHDPKVELFTMLVDGWPGGFFVLDTRVAETCDLAYFGLLPEAHGRGLGKWLLATAVAMGWEREGVRRMTVNTCSLDHPRALPLYQKLGTLPPRGNQPGAHPSAQGLTGHPRR